MSADAGREAAAKATEPLTSLTFDPAQWPKRLNLGCGWDLREGFVNVDFHAFHKPDLLADIRKLEFLPARYYDEIVAQDVLEHLPRTHTRPVLAHWNRLLRVGGTIALRVPSLLHIAKLIGHRGNQDPAKQEDLIQNLFGTQAYTGDFHLTSFTEVLLRHQLQEAGFRMRSIEVLHEWLFDAIAEKVEHIEGPAVVDRRELLEARDDEEFVHNCYREILGREPDPAGREYFLESLRTGAHSRPSVVASMFASTEYKNRGA